jgi:hypothetical protein
MDAANSIRATLHDVLASGLERALDAVETAAPRDRATRQHRPAPPASTVELMSLVSRNTPDSPAASGKF